MGPRAVEEDLLHVDQTLENFMGGNFIKGGTNQVPMADERTGTHKWDGSWLQKFEKKFFAPRLPQNRQGGGKMLEESPILVVPMYCVS